MKHNYLKRQLSRLVHKGLKQVKRVLPPYIFGVFYKVKNTCAMIYNTDSILETDISHVSRHARPKITNWAEWKTNVFSLAYDICCNHGNDTVVRGVDTTAVRTKK